MSMGCGSANPGWRQPCGIGSDFVPRVNREPARDERGALTMVVIEHLQESEPPVNELLIHKADRG